MKIQPVLDVNLMVLVIRYFCMEKISLNWLKLL